MLDPKQLDEMAKRFADNLPAGVRDLQQEVERTRGWRYRALSTAWIS